MGLEIPNTPQGVLALNLASASLARRQTNTSEAPNRNPLAGNQSAKNTKAKIAKGSARHFIELSVSIFSPL